MAINQIKQKQTPEDITKLEYAFSIGASTAEACFYADIGTSTYYCWCDEDTLLRDRFEALKEKPIFKSREVVIAAIETGDLNISKIERTIVNMSDEELRNIATGGGSKSDVIFIGK